MNAIVAFPTPAEKVLGEQFRSLRSSGAADPIGVRRDEAFAAFSAAGLPHRRIEAWHYTDLRSMLREVLPSAAAPDAEAVEEARAFVVSLGAGTGARVVLLDGRFLPELSAVPGLGAGVTVHSVLDRSGDGVVSPELAAAQDLGRVESVVALNAAMAQGGVSLAFAPGSKTAAPIEILSLLSGRSPAAVYARCYVELGANASATIIERHAALNEAPSQGHQVTVLTLGDGSTLDHVAKIHRLGDRALHVGTVLARLGASARFTSSTLIATGGVTRRQSYLEFAGASSQAHFRGISLLDGRCHADTTLVVTHTAPQCESRELYKHVLDNEATGIYQGKVIVAPGAQKTDGKMLSKAVFLADGPSMFNKPELEIFADDVVCGHGATTGSLDEDQLFYLRARGIPLQEAQAMLLEAFADEAIDEIADAALRAELTEDISHWLRRRGK